MNERRGWYLLKAALKALYDEHWPRNLRLEASCLRSSESDCAAKRFNSRLQWNPARNLTPFQKKLIKF